MLDRTVAASPEVRPSPRLAEAGGRRFAPARRPRLLATATLVATTFIPGTRGAQAGPGPVLAQQGGTVRTEAAGRNYTVEGLVVVIMLGLALFSVCRSSRRV